MELNDRQLRRIKRVAAAEKRLQEKWSKMLTDKGLSMNRGLSKRISYVGSSFDLAVIENLNTK